MFLAEDEIFEASDRDHAKKCHPELTDFSHNFSDPVGAQIILCWVGFVIQPHDAFAALYHEQIMI